jgi:hypothetical protein
MASPRTTSLQLIGSVKRKSEVGERLAPAAPAEQGLEMLARTGVTAGDSSVLNNTGPA